MGWYSRLRLTNSNKGNDTNRTENVSEDPKDKGNFLMYGKKEAEERKKKGALSSRIGGYIDKKLDIKGRIAHEISKQEAYEEEKRKYEIDYARKRARRDVERKDEEDKKKPRGGDFLNTIMYGNSAQNVRDKPYKVSHKRGRRVYSREPTTRPSRPLNPFTEGLSGGYGGYETGEEFNRRIAAIHFGGSKRSKKIKGGGVFGV